MRNSVNFFRNFIHFRILTRMKNLVPSKTKQKTIKSAFNYLNAYGSHGKENPSFDDAKTGVEQTISAIRLVFSSKK